MKQRILISVFVSTLAFVSCLAVFSCSNKGEHAKTEPSSNPTDDVASGSASHSKISKIKCHTTELCNELLALIPQEFETLASEFEERGFSEQEFGPNCHWAALGWHDAGVLKKPEFINFPEYEPKLAKLFDRLPKGSTYQTGDLVVFEHYKKEKVYKDERKFEFVTFHQPIHTAVYLKEGFAFQKENPHTPAFSIDSIDRMHQFWSAYISKRTGVNQHLEIHYYRKKTGAN